MAVFTVCRALKALAGAGVILAQICMKANRAHASNSYFFLCVSPVTAQSAQDAPFGACQVSVLSFLYRIRIEPRERPHAVAVPFPCYDYTVFGNGNQAVSRVWGTFKISKHKLRLR